MVVEQQHINMVPKLRRENAKAIDEKPKKISQVEEEKFMAIMRQVGDTNLSNLSGKHITEVLSQRRKIGEYIHTENMQEHERFKILQRNSLIQLGSILLFAIVILGLISVVDKTYLPQALTLIIGFVGGFGVGKSSKDPQP